MLGRVGTVFIAAGLALQCVALFFFLVSFRKVRHDDGQRQALIPGLYFAVAAILIALSSLANSFLIAGKTVALVALWGGFLVFFGLGARGAKRVLGAAGN